MSQTIPPPKRNMTIDENVEEMLTEFPDEPLHKLREYAKKGYVLYKTEQGSYITKFDYPDNKFDSPANKKQKTPKISICPETKVLNPKTRRCVNRTSKLGKEILKGLGPSLSPKKALPSPNKALPSSKKKALKKDPTCHETKILNPKTRRCVNRTSKLGKEILAQM